MVVLGPASPAGAQGADAAATPTDGGSQARWVIGELGVLLVGSVGGRMWAVRRARRREDGDSAADDPSAGPSLPPTAPRRDRPSPAGRDVRQPTGLSRCTAPRPIRL
jgi:hypothetical protein